MCRKNLLCIALFLFVFNKSWSNVSFNEYFTGERLRIDYYLTGDAKSTLVTFGDFHLEPTWCGSRINLIDTFDYGHYKIALYDSATNVLLYSKGFCTLFQEWQYTKEAQTIKRTFKQWIDVPFPKNTVKIVFYMRNELNIFETINQTFLNPSSNNIVLEKPINYPTIEYEINGDISDKLDIIIVAEGYTKEQMEKFKTDASRLTEALFSVEPFKQLRKHFNIRFLETPSNDEGTDVPQNKKWKNTIINTRFNTFNIERYLSVYHYENLAQVLSGSIFDYIIVLVNTKKYGGGGIYNFYSLAVADNIFADYVFIHEFGHAFGGLADEYDDADESNANFYNKNVEPWEPNITTLVQFEKKWKNMINPKTPIPTPVNQRYEKQIGVFEGAGYSKKGIYRPTLNCIMRNLEKKEFCPVCNQTIKNIILYYSK